MRLGVRGKLFTTSLVVLIIGGGAGAVWFEAELRDRLYEEAEAELGRHAAALALTFSKSHPDTESVSAMARAIGARVTLIAKDGAVQQDSAADPGRMENHADRPEVRAAREAGAGRSRRRSATLERQMIYVAVPTGDGGVLRAARSVTDLNEALWRFRIMLFVAAFMGLVVAGMMSLFASTLYAQAVEALVEGARGLSGAGRRRRIRVGAEDELGSLAGSFNRLADELEETVAELATERDRFSTVLDSLDDAVIALDDQLRIVLANPAAQRMLGWETQPVDVGLLDMVRIPALHALATGGRSADLEAEFELLGPPRKQVIARAAPIPTTGGTVLALHDVTEMRRLETVRKDFVANVSHELRTPVAVIRANAETLLDGALESPTHAMQFTEGIHRNAERLTELISDLLDLSRIEAGRYQIDLAPTVLLDAVLGIRESALAASNSTLEVTLDIPSDMAVMADPKALSHVLQNLVDNALKYAIGGTRVEVSSALEGQWIRIEVKDDGPGIDPRHRDRIFERFYRVDKGRTREIGGTGLGLSITRHLCEQMGGTCGVEGRMPKGSIFWIQLPAVKA